MACKICGRGNCTESFHSFEEQEEYDRLTEEAKVSLKVRLIRGMNNLNGEWMTDENNQEYYAVNLTDVVNKITDTE